MAGSRGHGPQLWQVVLVLAAVSALWLVVAVYFRGGISAHFNPAGSSSSPPSADPCWPARSSGQ